MNHRRTGANDHTFSASVGGYKLSANIREHGYVLSLTAKANFAAMNDSDIKKYWDLLFAAISEAMGTSYRLRKENPPMFEVPTLTSVTQGVNEW